MHVGIAGRIVCTATTYRWKYRRPRRSTCSWSFGGAATLRGALSSARPAPQRHTNRHTYLWTVLLTYPPVRNDSASHVFTVSVPSCGFTHFHAPVVWCRICSAATGWRKSSVKVPRSQIRTLPLAFAAFRARV